MPTFPTTFAFCFPISEGILVLSWLQFVSALFWLLAEQMGTATWPSTSPGLKAVCIGCLLWNACLGRAAIKTRSEACALALVLSFTVLLACLTAGFAVAHPGSCGVSTRPDASALGSLLSHLLWTADACMLMTILGWVTIAVGYAGAAYLEYMCVCFWLRVRATGADGRRLNRAICSLPVLRHGKDTPLPEIDGRAPQESTCAICLSEFEDGEELRLLPCVHLYHKECIDVWMRRQGISAACPMCKRPLLSRLPADGEAEDAATAGEHPMPDLEAADEPADPLDAASSSSTPLLASGTAALRQPLIARGNECRDCDECGSESSEVAQS
jgi:hypothetical protein